MSVDFTSLPAPRMVEELDYQIIKAQMLEDLRLRDPGYSEIYESDPGVKILEVAAFREMILRQRVNDAYMGTLVRYALGGDLDNLAAFYNLTRRTNESDIALRERVRIRVAGSSSAGPPEWYQTVALAASEYVREAIVTSPAPGEVLVAVLSNEGDAIQEATGAALDALGLMWGVARTPGEGDTSYRDRISLVAAPVGSFGLASPQLLQIVTEAVSAPDVRSVADTVTVRAVDVVSVDVAANIWLYPDTPRSVFDRLESDMRAAFDNVAGIGWDVTCSWLIGELQQPGVQRVEVTLPADNECVVISGTQAPKLRDVTLTLVGRDR